MAQCVYRDRLAIPAVGKIMTPFRVQASSAKTAATEGKLARMACHMTKKSKQSEGTNQSL